MGEVSNVKCTLVIPVQFRTRQIISNYIKSHRCTSSFEYNTIVMIFLSSFCNKHYVIQSSINLWCNYKEENV